VSERRVAMPLFSNALVSGLVVSSRIQSSMVNLTLDVTSAVGILYNVRSVLSTADVGFFYANSPDGVTLGSYTDNSALQTSTFTAANSTGWFMLSLPQINAPYVQFTVSGTGSNPVDTRVNAYLMLRMA
jgi:hypothetical protein